MALAVKYPIAMKIRVSICLGFLAASAFASCADPDATDDSDDDAAFSGVAQLPHLAPCTGPIRCFAQVRATDDTATRIASFAQPDGYAPADLIDAYHIDTKKTSTATIAIVDAYHYKNAETDLAKYRAQFGLPPCTTANGCFKRVNDQGKTSPLPSPSPPGDDWSVEAALDLDMASAACPTCKLVLVEAQDDVSDSLYVANDAAAAVGATVVSNSWGGVEDAGVVNLESHFTHAGVGYFASTGDDGFQEGGQGPSYPSTSAHVTAVGGTTLVATGNTRGWSEKAWSDGGSNCSKNIKRPGFQPGQTNCKRRMGADVSAVGDPNTGVAVFNADAGGWIVVGGTSASSPFVAAMMALYGLGAKGPAFAYSHTTEFFDVKNGKNGSCGNVLCQAGVAWDGPTGWGTPNGAKLKP